MTPGRQPREQGSALTIALLLIVVVAGYCGSFLAAIGSSSRSSKASTDRIRAIYIAGAIHSRSVVEVLPSLVPGATVELGSPTQPVSFGGGEHWATVTRSSDGLYSVRATGRFGVERVEGEGLWRKPSPLRDFALFAGGAGGALSSPVEFAGLGSDADTINGDVYVHGDVEMSGEAVVTGDVNATGNIINGTSGIQGDANAFTSRIKPPDLSAMNYESIADYTVNAAASFDADGILPETDPRHIFVKEFDEDELAPSPSFVFDNINYFFGDPYEDAKLGKVSVHSSGNRKIYFVDGNLWIEGKSRTAVNLVDSPDDGTVLTIVVKGNIYFADAVGYDDADHDGLLFVAISDGESYTDLDGDNQYDIGEPLLHDDGDGVYEGATEGSGNIYFGDPNNGPVGHVHGFMYAENNFEDHVNSRNGSSALEFEITGFMSAGHQVVINRELSGSDHAAMTVTLDTRIKQGSLEFPGFPGEPGGGASQTWRLVGWRLLDDM